MAEGRPGRLTIRHFPRVPAVCRERMAVGTCSRLIRRISWPKPSSSRVMTARVASGVRSRVDGPVPPVVRIRSQPSRSTMSISACATPSTPSGTILATATQFDCNARLRKTLIASPLMSLYTPTLARSDIVSTPIRAGRLSGISTLLRKLQFQYRQLHECIPGDIANQNR